ncbi:alpha/beta hydrolase [Vicingaceae bacterium]|nr:alpha/beta hydrolase [Vicingaceae bacterium]
MQCELITCVTADNVKLHGAFLSADTNIDEPVDLDAVVILHGLGGNFYGSRLLEGIARLYASLGVHVVLVNTRGHDGVNLTTVSGSSKMLGAAFEIVDECRYDVDGWCDWLVRRGHRQIGLAGHSLGAIKSIYSQALQPHPNVCQIVALSTSRLSHHRFLESSAKERFLGWFEKAQQMVADGIGNELMHVDFPFPTFISASAYVDKYGPAERYNWLRVFDKVRVSTLLMFGELELKQNAAFQGVLEEIDQLELKHNRVSVNVIDGADHFYSGRRAKAIEAVREWQIDSHPGAGG